MKYSAAFFRKMGRKGGKARNEKFTPEDFKRWGNMGGRPKSKSKKETEKK